jgi:UDP-N-acetylmuramate: L-alanyl-gamma-D-glutamyl-meso-diaminopimelate ligase
MKIHNIHIIAIGGAAMHNIALDLHAQGHHVTGSDDEIYEPSLGRLKKAGIAPDVLGWFPEKVTTNLDLVILGMHAKADNPELLKAQELGIKVYSYPEFVYHHSKDKKRVVIAGSHGKTTTTAMILHVLNKKGLDFDYLVGAQLDGFDRMVRLSDAPLIIIEGDEYLSSPIDRVPKIHHYKPDIAVITGIAWDHINVFPTFDNYKEQFAIFCQHIVDQNGHLFYYAHDGVLSDIVERVANLNADTYDALSIDADKNVIYGGQGYKINTIGHHNLQNMNAALNVCVALGITAHDFFVAIEDFKGANKRLQKITEKSGQMIYLDFAHAPSKVKATTTSFKDWFEEKPLLAVLELHTFSSLNKEFIVQYKGSLNAADQAIVFFNEHTLKMKNMPDLEEEFLTQAFGHPNFSVYTNEQALHHYLTTIKDHHILLMTSGNFNKMSLDF